MSRILNRQRQLAEAGRLRLGYTTEASNGKMRPVRSETWIFTSHDEEKAKVAASLWGGNLERWQPLGNGAQQWRVITEATAIDAVLPPGEPLTQAYESWNKGGATRRCDGVTEQFSGSPCLCMAEFGDNWYEQPKGRVCDTKSRLKVLLPDMPGLGSYRLETGSYYAADEIAGIVDTIKAAVGYETLVPVTLRIEQRTRVANGQTKQFVVPVVEVRGVTAGQILSGQGGLALAGSQPRQAIEAAPASSPVPSDAEVRKMIAACTSVELVRALWQKAKDDGWPQDFIEQACKDRATEITAAGRPDVAAQEPAESDADAIWQQIMAANPFDTMSELETDFAAKSGGITPGTASAGELAAYLRALRGAA